jgi:hypothetical protein
LRPELVRKTRDCGELIDVTFTGTWSTAWGDMVLKQSGASVTGRYPHDQGEITGTVTGNVLEAKWKEAPTRSEPGDAGDIQFTLTGRNSFTGCWRYGSSGDLRCDWGGTRLK